MFKLFQVSLGILNLPNLSLNYCFHIVVNIYEMEPECVQQNGIGKNVPNPKKAPPFLNKGRGKVVLAVLATGTGGNCIYFPSDARCHARI